MCTFLYLDFICERITLFPLRLTPELLLQVTGVESTDVMLSCHVCIQVL